MKFVLPYWVSDEKWRARLMLGGILALTVAEIALSAGIGFGFQAAINALVSKQALSFALHGAASIAGLFAVNVAGNQRQYMTDVLTLNWRGWLTKQFNGAWLGGKAHFKLQQGRNKTENPDQRIAENIPAVADQTLGLGLGLFRSVISLATFSALLIHLSPLMLAAAVVCAGGAAVAASKIGGPLQKIITGLQGCEAKFRHALVRVRDNAKPIALADLEPVEKATLGKQFNDIDAARRGMYKLQRSLGIFTTLNLQSATIVPIALAAPKFFYQGATMGSLELMRQVYGQVYGALSWFTQGYPLVANWSANVNQLITFSKALEETRTDITARGAAPGKPPINARFRTPKTAAGGMTP